VLLAGQSVKHEGVYAVYARGRVSWDGRGLSEYAQTHPDVQQFPPRRAALGEPALSGRRVRLLRKRSACPRAGTPIAISQDVVLAQATAALLRPASCARASATSVFSHVKPGSSRPKCPCAAVSR